MALLGPTFLVFSRLVLLITDLEPNEAAAVAAFEVYSGLTASSDESEVGGRTLRVRIVDQLKALNCMARRWGTLLNNGRSMGLSEEARHQ